MLSLNYAGGILVQFDTTHEYCFNDPCIHYCEQHNTLMISNHNIGKCDRIMIEGLTKDVMNRLRLELNKEHLENVTDKELVT
jgi:hypothetical protein